MSTMTGTHGWRAALEGLEGAETSARIREIRRDGLARFELLGFPTLTHEDWRFTDVSPLAETSFVLGGEGRARAQDLERFLFSGLAGPRLVFVNGRFDPALSAPRAFGRDAFAGTLADAARSHAALLEEHLDRLAGEDAEAFTALNSAFLGEGAFVHVGDGVTAEAPVHLLYVSTGGDVPAMTHPRTLVLLGNEARATVIEDHIVLGDGPSFANPVTEFVLGDGAAGRHYHLGRGSESASRISSLYVEQGASTDFASHSLLLGGGLVRNNVLPRLNGEDTESTLNGLYVPRGKQHHDNRMRVRHARANCRSRQYYRGILDDSARAMFTGRIIVDPGAQKTDAVQSNKNLLLSADALVETKPQLEIYADDVKCTHGATIGQIDDESVFYCQSRGIPESAARRLLVFAFANEIFERMELPEVRARLREEVALRLLAHGRNGR